MSQTVPLSEWAHRQCQCVEVDELEEIEPEASVGMQFDYALVMALKEDGAEARRWLNAFRRRQRCRTILSLTHLPEEFGVFGKGWDATLVDPSGRFDAVIPILLGPRLLAFQDEDLFKLLRSGSSLIQRPSVESAVNPEFLGSNSALVVHLTISQNPSAATGNLTVEQATKLGRQMRSHANPESEWLLSIGEGCHAGSAVQVLAVRSLYGNANRNWD